MSTNAVPEATTDVPTAGKYKPQLVLNWTVVSVPLAYGLFNAVKAALKLFSG